MVFHGLNEGSINPDLANERGKTSFNVDELTAIFDGGEQNTAERRRIEKIFIDDPNIPNTLQMFGLSSDECYETTLRTGRHVMEVFRKENMELNQQALVSRITGPLGSPTQMHGLYKASILRHGTDEIMSEFLNEKIIGAFVQTELGHGSDVTGLETTATYDVNTQEFVLDSPTLTSIKCWAGGLGRTASHAIVMAQLRTQNEWRGIHMFVVPLRDVDDSSPLPGITVGEMGPKMGLPGLDNGFLRLNKVRIPRRNMLMKHSQVLADGTYVKPEFDRASYGMMVLSRVFIVWDTAVYMAHVCTIAVRYNAIRRQGKIKKEGEDVKILDYKTQQYKLFPQVALTYALKFAQHKLVSMFLSLDADKTNEFHALSAGMKALSTTECSTAAETCRQACGGLGYLQSSGLPSLCSGLAAACTYEGDNTILNLQTARYLMKAKRLIRDGKAVGETVGYLHGAPVHGRSCMIEFVEMFASTTAELVNRAFNKLNNEMDTGKEPELAWHDNTVDLVKCARYHCKVFVIQSLHDFFVNTQLSPSLRVLLEKLFSFLGVYWTIENSGDFIEFGNISATKMQELRARVPDFLKDLRGDMVGLVDAFDLSDAALISVIGSYDGRAYERLYEYWTNLPSNQRHKQLANKSKL